MDISRYLVPDKSQTIYPAALLKYAGHFSERNISGCLDNSILPPRNNLPSPFPQDRPLMFGSLRHRLAHTPLHNAVQLTQPAVYFGPKNQLYLPVVLLALFL
jgi:hypothetical protein